MYLCIAFRKCNWIVSWCNGSTTVFGSVCRGSNPRETTQKILRQKCRGIFCFWPDGIVFRICRKCFRDRRRFQSDAESTAVRPRSDCSFVGTGLEFCADRTGIPFAANQAWISLIVRSRLLIFAMNFVTLKLCLC